jgi:tellurite resistance protein TehA-like permease
MKHHDRYFVSASLFLASFVLSGMVNMGLLTSLGQADLLELVSWILGTAGILMFGLAISEHRKYR